VCTDSFGCCQNPLATYAHFEILLNNISQGIYQLKIAKARLDSLVKEQPTNKPVLNKTLQQKNNNTVVTDDSTGTDHSKKDSTGVIFNVSTSDLVFASGRITGITLHQLQDTSKPKKQDSLPADPSLALDSLWFLFEKSIPTDYIMRQIIFRNNMVKSNMSYTSPPIYPYGDRLGLVLQMPVSDSVRRMGTMPSNTITLSADIQVLGRPLFSFSAGSFVGMGVRSGTYEWQQVPVNGSNIVQSRSPYQLVNTGKGTIPVGLGGMVNVTWPWWPGVLPHTNLRNIFRVGFSGGVGATIAPTPIQVGYMLGGTLSVGTYQQFHFTIGPIAMNVNELKSSPNLNNVFTTQPTTSPYDQKIKVGAFLAISYTLFTPKGTGTMQNQVINAN
jgi:hypothetical protein